MKRFSPSQRWLLLATQGLFLGVGILLMSVPARAQELIKNWNFEQPLGPTNWTVGYLFGGADNWEIKDRIRAASMYPQGSATKFFGGCFRPLTLKLAHVYFTQTVTNLTLGHAYNFSGNMWEDWWKGVSAGDSERDHFLVYIELIGGQGTPMVDGRFSMIATNDFTDSNGDPEPNIDAPYTYPTAVWRPFYTQQIPHTNRTIEVRLHYNKVGFAIYDKTWTSAAYFDDISLTP
jgi:hypothetical protein